MKAAKALVDSGRAQEVIPRLKALSAQQFDHLRNYLPHRVLARAYCAVGDREAARRHFDLYACVLAIDFVQQSCWIGGYPSNGVDPDIPQDCRRAACGESFVDEEEAGRADRYSALRSSLAADKRTCGLAD